MFKKLFQTQCFVALLLSFTQLALLIIYPKAAIQSSKMEKHE